MTRDGKPAWIVGGTNHGLLALRWDGLVWRRGATRDRGHRGLVGGVATSRTSMLGVGYYRPWEGNGSLKPVSGRIWGSTFRERRVPDPPGERAALADVIALPGGRAWAVGSRLQAGRLRAYAVRWSGSRWLRDEPVPGSTSGLLAIERSPSGTIWAVGWRESSAGRHHPLIVRHHDGRWASVATPTLPEGSAVLVDVAFRSGRDGWAVGYLTATGSDRHSVFLLHWNGSRWTREPLPWADDFAALPRAISVDRTGIWVAGTQTATAEREARGFIARREQGTWRTYVLDVPDSVRSEVLDVAATRSGATAVANVASSLLVLAACDSSATPGAASSRRRIKVSVSRIGARKRTTAIAQRLDPDDEALVSAGGAVSASRAARLPRPVTAVGFRIVDRSVASGLAQETPTYGGFAADFDGDDWRDIFYSRHGSLTPRLALAGPDGFSDAPYGAFSAVDRHGCDAADVDQDGTKDILCAVGASRGKAIHRNELSLAPLGGDGHVARDGLGISDPLGRGRQIAFLHLDGDAYPEVFIGNAPDRDDGLPASNRFFRNVEGHFVPAPGAGLDRSHGAICAEVTDLESDGDDDLVYCTAYGFSGRTAGLRLMRNEGGRLVDRTRALGVRAIGDVDVAFVDVTGDGRRDLVQVSADLIRVSKRTASGYRRIWSARTSGAVAVAGGDVNADGLADLYVARGTPARNTPDLLLVSRSGGRAFTSVRIPQTSRGRADDVIAIDHDHNGLTDFVVLNGRARSGPVKLLASYPH